jgi:O-methyltransferase involved in polyketide biosynthesis
VTDHAWIKQIPASLATPPLFIAEGLLMYLGSSEVKSLLFALKRRFPGSRLLADVISPVHFTLGVRR